MCLVLTTLRCVTLIWRRHVYCAIKDEDDLTGLSLPDSGPDGFRDFGRPSPGFTSDAYIYLFLVHDGAGTARLTTRSGSFQADVAPSRRPETLIRQNQISLPFKSCQAPPPPIDVARYDGRRLTINPSVLAPASSFR